MTNHDVRPFSRSRSFMVALLMLDGMIAAMEANLSIPVQLSELKTLKILLTKNEKEWEVV